MDSRHLPRIYRSIVLLVLFAGGDVLRAGPSLGLREKVVVESAAGNALPILGDGWAAPVFVAEGDFAGVARAAGDLCADVERVSGIRPAFSRAERPAGDVVIIAGTVGRSAWVDELAKSGKLETGDLAGKWEAFSISMVEAPWPGVARALVIAGSDKRGTIYGIYELSEQLGVSPWYWWADVPPKRRSSAYVAPGRFVSGEPVVRYRGIFLNDEAPCLTGWAAEKFGGLNARFYTKVFELLLRLRGNTLWPAMWDNAFNEDDPENPRLADEYGIVMGTSHHEPMMRAHKEWTTRRDQYGNGKWDYASNAEALQRFFREGISRNAAYDNLVTIGMRGDGDEGMASQGSMAADIALLENIFADQRTILGEELQRDPATVPQLWALFTEVQSFYEHGLRPPDDVTLLWTDDNTGSLRRLPTEEERGRSGGAGIYYHFDMHGGPYAYQWINTNNFPKIAEQMHLAASYGATRIWIVNVGDLKPLELPIEFFLRMAWNPASFTKDDIAAYTRRWAERDFGPEHAAEIAYVVSRYTKYNGWRKPELVKPDTFSLLHYHEAERVEAAWSDLVRRAEALYARLPPDQRDAFFQLVLHPTRASALMAEINILAGRNQLYAKQGRLSTNVLAGRVRALFREDQALSDTYNHTLADGKWNHLMDQAHLGQFSWEPPVVNVMPAVSEVMETGDARFGVAVEGDVNTWPDHFGSATLPAFDSFHPRRSYVDVFAIGGAPFEAAVAADETWIRLIPEKREGADLRYWVEVDWAQAPSGTSTGTLHVRGGGRHVRIRVPATKASAEQRRRALGRFASLTGPVAFAASAAPSRVSVDGVGWEAVPDYGRGEAGMAVYPVTAPSVLPPAEAPRLRYPIYLPRPGRYEVTLVLGPVMDFVPDRGMRIALALGDEAPRVLDLFADRATESFLGRNWTGQVSRDNVRYLRSTHHVASAGENTLTVSMVDPGIVLQKVIISDGRLPQSYFGPPEMERLE